MELLEWNPGLETGIELLDQQHKRFLKKANHFYIQLQFQRGQQAAEEELDFVQDYLLSHFQAELAYMLENEYPKARDHEATHDMLSVRVKQTSLDLKANDFAPEAVDNFYRFVMEWVSGHIMREDMEFSRYLKAKDLKNLWE